MGWTRYKISNKFCYTSEEVTAAFSASFTILQADVREGEDTRKLSLGAMS